MNYELRIKKQKNAGYTIIETMIAISLFIIIIMTGMGALLNSNRVYNKSQNMMSIIDSLNFVMDEMSTNLRTGYNYRCFLKGSELVQNNINEPNSCTGTNGGAIAFEQEEGKLYTGDPPQLYNEDQWVYYIGDTGEKDVNEDTIYGIFKSIDGLNTYVQLTPNEIHINPIDSFFTVFGAESFGSGDDKQPFVTIKLVGEIVFKDITTPFSLQTSVSQRNIDVF
ncbi:MAG: hypothetical protein UW07_C0009G0007 [Candidatus Nomurabacteria bacterium GW2011_GWF2_43_8]|uniref:Prepilin-type N-terminal cleavage/methylation domain-containing protein n=3 Tax=Candidatus Nomuraibacteriota TaxID=1752729 RepID=A0A0G1FRP1_9BACT|nr:MAG: hypothetical protein UV76_C0002G0123 [Candidatus Nomurabacteria bacterium GW2011_GWA2_43_15]KKT19835.1 MAG: hypothetical protein UW02_C0004G0012 [Candidatus Nomurabacteria bacterium GW2011_GWB1_43_7]KKT24723.1 MAG: hypothetical protein UW07_C0009G0007 [Candidatus Nomurabacteria bacterium GW2011_GWF2_43_8]